MTAKIQDLKTATIVDLYNTVAVWKSLKIVKKFADRATAEARLEKIMADHDLILEGDSEPFVKVVERPEDEPDYTAEGAQVDPTEDAEFDALFEGTQFGQAMQAKRMSVETDEVQPAEQTEDQPTEQVAPEKSVAEQVRELTEKRAKGKGKKAAGGKRGPAPDYADDKTITVLVEKNPKKAGSASYARFEAYKTGQTVAEYLAAGGTRADLKWDVAHEFVKVG